MNGFRRELTQDRDLQVNQGATERTVDEAVYVRHLTPGLFVPFATAAYGTAGQSAGLGKWPTIDYPDGVSSYAVASIRRPVAWVSGNLKLTVFYTSQTAGTANFSILWQLCALPLGGNMSNTGVTVLQFGTAVAPGPTAADDEKNFIVYTATAPLLPGLHRINTRIGRDGAGDANNNVLQMVDAWVEFIPAGQAL